jgi:hypothetical protein
MAHYDPKLKEGRYPLRQTTLASPPDYPVTVNVLTIQPIQEGWLAWNNSTSFVWIHRGNLDLVKIEYVQLLEVNCDSLPSCDYLKPQVEVDCYFIAIEILKPPGPSPYFVRNLSLTHRWCLFQVPGVIMSVQTHSAVIWSQELGRVGLSRTTLPAAPVTEQLTPLTKCKMDVHLSPKSYNDGFQCLRVTQDEPCSVLTLTRMGIFTALGHFSISEEDNSSNDWSLGRESEPNHWYHTTSQARKRGPLEYVTYFEPSFTCQFELLDLCGVCFTKPHMIRPHLLNQLATRPTALYQAYVVPNRLGHAQFYRTVLVWEVLPPFLTPIYPHLETTDFSQIEVNLPPLQLPANADPNLWEEGDKSPPSPRKERNGIVIRNSSESNSQSEDLQWGGLLSILERESPILEFSPTPSISKDEPGRISSLAKSQVNSGPDWEESITRLIRFFQAWEVHQTVTTQTIISLPPVFNPFDDTNTLLGPLQNQPSLILAYNVKSHTDSNPTDLFQSEARARSMGTPLLPTSLWEVLNKGTSETVSESDTFLEARQNWF